MIVRQASLRAGRYSTAALYQVAVVAVGQLPQTNGQPGSRHDEPRLARHQTRAPARSAGGHERRGLRGEQQRVTGVGSRDGRRCLLPEREDRQDPAVHDLLAVDVDGSLAAESVERGIQRARPEPDPAERRGDVVVTSLLLATAGSRRCCSLGGVAASRWRRARRGRHRWRIDAGSRQHRSASMCHRCSPGSTGGTSMLITFGAGGIDVPSVLPAPCVRAAGLRNPRPGTGLTSAGRQIREPPAVVTAGLAPTGTTAEQSAVTVLATATPPRCRVDQAGRNRACK